MAITTNISWADHTHNPWIGCTQVSPACDHCYAMVDQDHKRGRVDWGAEGARWRVRDHSLRQPRLWDEAARREGVRRRVFCCSLADVFDQHASILPEWKLALWAMIRDTPHLDWLLLTKRPQSVASDIARYAGGVTPANAWLGFSAEDQAYFDRRWALVCPLDFRVKFCSYEPALGPVRLSEEHRGQLHWLIYGGETSFRRNQSRRADPQWAIDAKNDCEQFGVAYWYKQTGNWIGDAWHGKTSAIYRAHHDRLEGQVIQQLPVL